MKHDRWAASIKDSYQDFYFTIGLFVRVSDKQPNGAAICFNRKHMLKRWMGEGPKLVSSRDAVLIARGSPFGCHAVTVRTILNSVAQIIKLT